MSADLTDVFVEAEGLGSGSERPKSFPSGRICAEQGCGTVLSIYNACDRCSLHGHVDPPPLINRGERSHQARHERHSDHPATVAA